MTGFFSNPWVVGIGGGILSGFIVFLVTRFAFSSRDKNEYYRNLTTANKEVIYSVRSTISENVLPSLEIINALIVANSRKYRVDQKDMYNLGQICEELIKEVMDSSFISSIRKMEYCDMISGIKVNKEEKVIQEVNEKLSSAKYKNELVTRFSLLLGVITTITIALYSITNLKENINSTLYPNDVLKLGLPYILVIVVSTVILGSLGSIGEWSIRLPLGIEFMGKNRIGNKNNEKAKENKHEDEV